MLKQFLGGWIAFPSQHSLLRPCVDSPSSTDNRATLLTTHSFIKPLKQSGYRRCCARRRVRYEGEDEEGYGYNAEIALLECYSQSAREEALLVRAMVDEVEVEVVIFKGFSSSLSCGTSPDPSTSVVPARAVIKSIDKIKGPFDPSNIVYIEKGLTLESFKTKP